MSEDLGFRFTWYGHATVYVESEAGTSILVDPWFGHPLAPVGAEAIERCEEAAAADDPGARHRVTAPVVAAPVSRCCLST